MVVLYQGSIAHHGFWTARTNDYLAPPPTLHTILFGEDACIGGPWRHSTTNRRQNKTRFLFSRRQPRRPPDIPSYQLPSSLCVTMHPLSCLLGLVVLPSAARAWTPASSDITDALAADSLDNLLKLVSNGTLKSYLATQDVSQTCTAENVARRKDYTTLSQEERLDYVTAMKCLMDAPALTPPVSPMRHESTEQLADSL